MKKKKKITIIGSITVIGLLIFAAGVYLPGRPTTGQLPQRLYCGQALAEQVAKAEAIYEVRTSPQQATTNQFSCIYDLTIESVLLGEELENKSIENFIEDPYMDMIPEIPIICKKPDNDYVILVTGDTVHPGRYRCGNSAIYDMGKKQQILDLIAQRKERE